MNSAPSAPTKLGPDLAPLRRIRPEFERGRLGVALPAALGPALGEQICSPIMCANFVLERSLSNDV